MSLLENAYRLRRGALAMSRTTELDPATTMFLVKEEAYYLLLKELRETPQYHMEFDLAGATGPLKLFNIPVLVTRSAPDDQPPIDLVMRPLFYRHPN